MTVGWPSSQQNHAVSDPIGAADFKAALRCFPSGVTVVTSCVDGLDHAMTASAFSAVSLNPPMVLVCVNRASRFAEAIGASPWWGVSILAEHGEAAARWFATSGRQLIGQLDAHPHTRGPSGVALLDESLAQLECRTERVVTAGDHDIFIGAVASVAVTGKPRPLVYWAGEYRQLDG